MIDLEHFNEYLKYYKYKELQELKEQIGQELLDRDHKEQIKILQESIRSLTEELNVYKEFNDRLLAEIDRLDYELLPVINIEEELQDLF